MTRPIDATSQPGRKRGSDEQGLPASIPLGHVRGVEVDAHWSVLVTEGLFATVLATSTLPGAHPGDTGTAYWLVAVGTAVVFILTLLAHELAHAVVARAYGIQVNRITLWLLGGVTDLGGPSPTARADALVALAGPATSLGIGTVSAILAAIVGTSGLVGTALVWLASVSVLLAVFNLLPGAPLDGGRVLRAPDVVALPGPRPGHRGRRTRGTGARLHPDRRRPDQRPRRFLGGTVALWSGGSSSAVPMPSRPPRATDT